LRAAHRDIAGSAKPTQTASVMAPEGRPGY
jgi:hypothetical protein